MLPADIAAIPDTDNLPFTGAELKSFIEPVLKQANDRAEAAERALAEATKGGKTAADKTAMETLGTQLAAYLVGAKVISPEKQAAVAKHMAQEGGVQHYLKYAVDKFVSADARAKAAEEKLANPGRPSPIGRVVQHPAKVASDGTDELAEHRINGTATSDKLAKAAQKWGQDTAAFRPVA